MSLYYNIAIILEKLVKVTVEVKGKECFFVFSLPLPLPLPISIRRREVSMSNELNKVIYSMIGVSKYYDKKPVLKNIYLSYFYGAKIGVLGLNGSGKSSLLRILAGKDTEFNGETVLSPGHTVGFLEQEPELDDTKTVRGVVEEGVHEIVAALKEYNL